MERIVTGDVTLLFPRDPEFKMEVSCLIGSDESWLAKVYCMQGALEVIHIMFFYKGNIFLRPDSSDTSVNARY